MTPENFCYWLRGFLELTEKDNLTLDSNQVHIISKHLRLVLADVTSEPEQKSEPEKPKDKEVEVNVDAKMFALSPEEIKQIFDRTKVKIVNQQKTESYQVKRYC